MNIEDLKEYANLKKSVKDKWYQINLVIIKDIVTDFDSYFTANGFKVDKEEEKNCIMARYKSVEVELEYEDI